MSIHIKHPGLLHKHLHKSPHAHLSLEELHAKLASAKRSGNVKLERELVFAINARHFHHGK
jgi:hypothetical protein